MAADKFRGGIYDNIETMLNGPEQRRRKRGIVDDRRQTMTVSNLGDFLVVRHVIFRISRRLHINSPGVLVHQFVYAFRILWIKVSHLDAQFFQRLRE